MVEITLSILGVLGTLSSILFAYLALEEMLIEALSFDDVLVVLEGEYLVIDVYTNNDITAEVFISVTRLAKEKFDSNYKVKVIKTPIED